MAHKDKGHGGWSWAQKDSCLIGTSPALQDSSKIASFDMDDTIVTRKSGAKFPINADDWKFLNDKVAPTIKKLFD